MLNYLNQLELQAQTRMQDLRQQAETERQLRNRWTFSWAAPVLHMVAPLKLLAQPKVKSYR